MRFAETESLVIIEGRDILHVFLAEGPLGEIVVSKCEGGVGISLVDIASSSSSSSSTCAVANDFPDIW